MQEQLTHNMLIYASLLPMQTDAFLCLVQENQSIILSFPCCGNMKNESFIYSGNIKNASFYDKFERQLSFLQ
jgi:hypothetical protein